jgi:Protein of unknown function (DUF732)
MFRLPIVIGALAITIASPLAAHANAAANPDDQFVNALAAQGITGDRGTITATGHTVCDRVPTTATVHGKRAQLNDVMNALHVGPYEAWFVIRTAKDVYCPQYVGVRV